MVTSPEDRPISVALENARLSAPRPRELLPAIVLGLGYYAGVHAGMALTFPSSPVSTLWPPNAILLAALLLAPFRLWWVMLAAALPAHFVAEIALGVPLPMAGLWFISNVFEALVGAALIRTTLDGPPHFGRVRDLSVFLLAAVLLAPFLSSFLDGAFVAAVGWRYSDFWEVWRIRVFSNALAALILVPLVVSWFQAGLKWLRRMTFAQSAELGVLLIGVSLTSAAVFAGAFRLWEFANYPYLPLPFLIWAAVRFGVPGVSLSGLVLAAFAISGVVYGRGPFLSDEPQNAALSVQTFLVIAQFPLLLLAASLAELQHRKNLAARQEERLNLALDAAGMGTWEWDFARRLITWQSAQSALSPLRSRSRSPASLLRLVHRHDREMVHRAIVSVLEEGTVEEIECRFIDGRRRHRWMTIKGRIQTDSRLAPRGMIGIYIDTTHRKSQDMQARRQREQLARLGRISTLGELSGAIAHELNQPLTAILLNAQAALRELDGDSDRHRELAEMLQDIVEQDKRAAAVIRQLRALLLRGTTEVKPVDLNECIKDVLGIERADLTAHNVMTDLYLETGMPSVIGDRVQLQQVLLNLVVNARDAMSEVDARQRRLRIRSTAADGLVSVEVSDTGCGLKDVEAIFEPFYSTKDHGIGMGLAICRTIVTAHGGRLWATSNPAGGATFHLSIPFETARLDATESVSSSTP